MHVPSHLIKIFLILFGSCTLTTIYHMFSSSITFDSIRNCYDVVRYSYYETSLCEHGQPTKLYTAKPENCPKRVVTVQQGGRLCNQIWEYAAVWAVAKKTGLVPYVPTCLLDNVGRMYENLSVQSFENIGNCPLNTTTFLKTTLDNWDDLSVFILPMYSTQPEIVLSYLADIPKEFVMKKQLIEESQKQLWSVARKLPPNAIFVGVHIRRTDYIPYLQQRYKVKPADLSFYEQAMQIFENKYQNVVFIMVSDEPDWCDLYFGTRKNVYVLGKEKRNTAEIDLAILSSCNHTIIDYGSYGAWGAVMAGGDTIYYALTGHFTTRIGKVLENWKAL